MNPADQQYNNPRNSVSTVPVLFLELEETTPATAGSGRLPVINIKHSRRGHYGADGDGDADGGAKMDAEGVRADGAHAVRSEPKSEHCRGFGAAIRRGAGAGVAGRGPLAAGAPPCTLEPTDRAPNYFQ